MWWRTPQAQELAQRLTSIKTMLRTDRLGILDVRTPAEFETAHIDGSYSVPLDLLNDHGSEVAEQLDQGHDTPIVKISASRAQTSTDCGFNGWPAPRHDRLDHVDEDWRRRVSQMNPNPDYDASDELDYGIAAYAWLLRGVYPPPYYGPDLGNASAGG